MPTIGSAPSGEDLSVDESEKIPVSGSKWMSIATIVEHIRTKAQTLTNKTLTAPTIGSFANATHGHTDAASGGIISVDIIGHKRLALVSATPVTTTDQTAKTTIYWTDGTTNLSVAVPATTNTPFDIFYDQSDDTLSTVDWTNDTTRATALVYESGYLAKTGDTDKLYLGTGRTTGVSGQIECSTSKRFLWNYYNRIDRILSCVDGTDTWNYTTATWRASNNNTTDGVGRVACVIGVAEDIMNAVVTETAANSSGGCNAAGGVGIDSTSANSAQLIGVRLSVANAQVYFQGVCKSILSAGGHFIQHLEISDATGTTSWFGDSGAPTVRQNGMMVEIKG